MDCAGGSDAIGARVVSRSSIIAKIGRKTDFVAKKLPNEKNMRGVTFARKLVNTAAGVDPLKRWRHGVGNRDTAINACDAEKVGRRAPLGGRGVVARRRYVCVVLPCVVPGAECVVWCDVMCVQYALCRVVSCGVTWYRVVQCSARVSLCVCVWECSAWSLSFYLAVVERLHSWCCLCPCLFIPVDVGACGGLWRVLCSTWGIV